MSSFDPLVMPWADRQKFGGPFLGEVTRLAPSLYVHQLAALASIGLLNEGARKRFLYPLPMFMPLK